MSEFNIEEKANAYDIALNKAKTLLSKCKRVSDKASMIYRAEDIESMFPELKEVDDEQIRNWLISQLEIKSDVNNSRELELMILKSIDWLKKQSKSSVKWNKNTGENKPAVNHSILMKTIHGISEGEWKGECWYQYRWATCVKDSEVLFWIELSDLDKQCEQKTINKYEHKFDIGDWITCPEFPPTSSTVAKVVYIVDDQYDLEYLDGTKEVSAIDKVDSTYYRWTIKDAKDGDVLATSARAFIYYDNNNGGIRPGCYCGINTLGLFQIGLKRYWTEKKVYPATKEQHDTLFAKMKESGYEWDAVKKQLKEIEK